MKGKKQSRTINWQAIITVAIPLLVTSGFIFLGTGTGIKRKLLVYLYCAITAGMAAGGLYNLHMLRRKANRRVLLAGVFVNTVFVAILAFLIHFSHVIPSGLTAWTDTLKKTGSPSALISIIILCILSAFIIFNYAYHVRITGIPVKKHAPRTALCILLFLCAGFYIQSGSVKGILQPVFAYTSLAAVMFPVFLLNLLDLKMKKTRGKIIAVVSLSVFMAAELAYLLISLRMFPAFNDSMPFHAVIIILLAGNFLFGMIALNIFWKIPLQKSLLPFLAYLLIVTAGVTYLLAGKELFLFGIYLAAGFVFVALPFTGYMLFYDRKKTELKVKVLTVGFLVAAGLSGLYIMINPPGILPISITSGSFSILMAVPLLVQVILTLVIFFHIRKGADNSARTKSRSTRAEKVRTPFDAYRGNAEYIFVSYSHRDMKEVFSHIHLLFKKGLRIWYDEGIEPGDEWPEIVGRALGNCGKFLVFLSRSAVLSRNVRNEINFAFTKKKEIIVVMLEKTPLTYGLNLQLGTVQSIKKYEITDKEFINKVLQILKTK